MDLDIIALLGGVGTLSAVYIHRRINLKPKKRGTMDVGHSEVSLTDETPLEIRVTDLQEPVLTYDEPLVLDETSRDFFNEKPRKIQVYLEMLPLCGYRCGNGIEPNNNSAYLEVVLKAMQDIYSPEYGNLVEAEAEAIKRVQQLARLGPYIRAPMLSQQRHIQPVVEDKNRGCKGSKTIQDRLIRSFESTEVGDNNYLLRKAYELVLRLEC